MATAPDTTTGDEPPSVFRDVDRTTVELPMHTLKPFPHNPKRPITGKYRKGLEKNLEQFGIRDYLKVWPDPRSLGQYYVLDGNQRYDVLLERAETELGIKTIGDDDPNRDAKLAAIRSQAMNISIPCMVMQDLDPLDAEVFNASFDRNHAVYDEGKLADWAASVQDRHADLLEGLAAKRAGLAATLKGAIRPESAFVNPSLFPAPRPTTDLPSSLTDDTLPKPDGESEDFSDNPWGAPPPQPPSATPTPSVTPKETLIPLMISLSQTAFSELTGPSGILKSMARPIREKVVVEAMRNLNAVLAEIQDDGKQLDSTFYELALMVVQRRIVALKPEPESGEES